MSKSIVIPSTGPNPYIIKIGNATYKYKRGETVTVPDEVAALIEANDNMRPHGVRGRQFELHPVMKTDDMESPVGVDPVTGRLYGTDTSYTLPAASADAIGGVKLGDAVADATGDTDVVAQLNALIASLVGAGVIAPATEGE